MKTRYHDKTDAELEFIIKDATEAMRCARDLGDLKGEFKYADQVADCCTERYLRLQKKGKKNV